MTALPKQIAEHLDILCCPGCGANFETTDSGLRRSGCGHAFEVSDDLPMLYRPEDGVAGQEDLTRTVKAFYEETPFPDYNDFDSVATLCRPGAARNLRAHARRASAGGCENHRVRLSARGSPANNSCNTCSSCR